MNDDLLKCLLRETKMEAFLKDQKISAMPLRLRGNDTPAMIDSHMSVPQGHLIKIFRQPRHIPISNHSHSYVELVYMYSGSTSVVIDSRIELQLNTHDLLLIKQGVMHSATPAGKKDIVVSFLILPEFFKHSDLFLEDENVFRHLIAGSANKNPSVANYLLFHLQELLPPQNLLENMIWSLFHPSREREAIDHAIMGILLQELLGTLTLEKLLDTSQYETNIIVSAYKYMDAQYPTATLEDFSCSVNQPSYYISRLFKKYTGNTFKESIQSVRLAKASYLLACTFKPVEKIITEVGYENSSYFHRIFKKAYGMTPKQYRNSAAKGFPKAGDSV